MPQEPEKKFTYVVKVHELPALNFLESNHARPQSAEWINRGTDQKLKQSSVDMLLRTLFQPTNQPSLAQLHQDSGLRLSFENETERARFSREFDLALNRKTSESPHMVTSVFADRDHAEMAISELRKSGVTQESISILWRTSRFLDSDMGWVTGHSKLSVAAAVAGSGIAGAAFGVAILTLPGLGAVAAAGGLAASAFGSAASIGTAFGATCGAIAKMLTDHDVDGVAATYYEQQIIRGKIFVSVDTRLTGQDRSTIFETFERNGGVRLSLVDDGRD